MKKDGKLSMERKQTLHSLEHPLLIMSFRKVELQLFCLNQLTSQHTNSSQKIEQVIKGGLDMVDLFSCGIQSTKLVLHTKPISITKWISTMFVEQDFKKLLLNVCLAHTTKTTIRIMLLALVRSSEYIHY